MTRQKTVPKITNDHMPIGWGVEWGYIHFSAYSISSSVACIDYFPLNYTYLATPHHIQTRIHANI